MPEFGAMALPEADCLLPGDGRTSRETLLLSLHLSKLAYDMDIAPYLDDGWQDVSVQVDDLLLTDLKNRRAILQAAAKAKGKMDKADPISQYRGFRRQQEEVSICKAVVLSRRVQEKTLIAVAFTGTTRRIYEWLGNLRIEEEEGFHAGFLQMTKVFEENAARILFPSLQKSLLDILDEMRAGSEMYDLFVTGHSQGAALMQVYICRLLSSGVPGTHVRGVGFASPGVACMRSIELAAYPIVHVINADDIVARIGGRMHIGMCRVLPVSQGYRSACYGPRADTPAVRDMLDFMHGVRSTQDALVMGIALTEQCRALPEGECEEVFVHLMRMYLPEKISLRLTGYARRMAKSVGRRLQAKHEKAFGAIDSEKKLAYSAQWAAYLNVYGTKEGMAALFDVMLRPHALADPQQKRAYQTLVEEFSDQLVSCMWCCAEPAWARQLIKVQKDRAPRAPYDRFHPLTTQRRRNRDGI